MSELDYRDVTQLRLVEISGQKVSSRLPQSTRTRTRLEMAHPDDDDDHGVLIRAVATLLPGVEEDAPDDAIYEGSVTYYVALRGEFPEGSAALQLVWPYLRAGLPDQCGRIGGPSLSLPLFLGPENFNSGSLARTA